MDTEPGTKDQQIERLSPLAVEAGLQELLKSSKRNATIGFGTTAIAGLYVYLLVKGWIDWSGSLGLLGFVLAGGLIVGKSVARARAARRIMKRLGDQVTFTIRDRVLTCEGDGHSETLTLMYREKLLLEAGGIPIAEVR